MNKRHLVIYNVLRPFVTLYLHCRLIFAVKSRRICRNSISFFPTMPPIMIRC